MDNEHHPNSILLLMDIHRYSFLIQYYFYVEILNPKIKHATNDFLNLKNYGSNYFYNRYIKF